MDIIRIYIIFILFVSCSPKKEPFVYSEKTGVPLTVIVPAGERFKRLPNSYLPCFFNLATLDNNNSSNTLFIIPSERKSKGSVIYTKPISMFSYSVDTTRFNFIVTRLSGSEKKHLGEDFSDFALNNENLKESIESWFKEQCPYTICSDFRWSNTYKALIQIDKTINDSNAQ